MSNYSNTKATIAANVYTNHNNEVTAEMVKAGINAVVDTLIAGGFIYKGVAHPGDAAVSPDANVFYIASEAGTYTNKGGLVVNDGEVCILKYNGSWSKEVTGAATAAEVSALGHEVDDNTSLLVDLQNAVQGLDGDTLYIVDGNGYIVAKIDADGVHALEVEAGGAKLSTFTDILPSFYEDKLYVTDGDGNIVAFIDADGFHAANLAVNDWAWKNIATYGDSIVAINNGDFSYPYNLSNTQRWGNRVADYLKAKNQYGRGVGGQGYRWNTGVGNGGSVTFVRTDTGQYDSRNDSYNLDNYTGAIPAGCTAVRGCLSSWLRIKTMFPASIKDDIHAIIVMAHNDGYDTTDAAFIANDTTDPEWAASGADYYGKMNGDYNINTLRGAIASTLMKLQFWMPNAIIILSTGISGNGLTGQLNPDINGAGLINIADAVREMAKIAAIPLIDSAATDGINGWNRTEYITDSIHPYSVAGSKMLARAIIGGMKTILPNI